MPGFPPVTADAAAARMPTPDRAAGNSPVTGEPGRAVALDHGGYAVAFRLSPWRSNDRPMICWAFSILEGSYGLLECGPGHYGG